MFAQVLIHVVLVTVVGVGLIGGPEAVVKGEVAGLFGGGVRDGGGLLIHAYNDTCCCLVICCEEVSLLCWRLYAKMKSNIQ